MNHLPITLETKDIIGLVLAFSGCAFALWGMLVWPRLRDAALCVITFGAILTERFDINIMSAYWYRGTTRGFELTALDILAFALLVSTMISPRPGQTRGFWPAGLGPFLLFVAYCGISVAAASPSIFGLFELSKFIRGIVFFLAAAFYVRSRREVNLVIVSLAAATCLEGAWALRQRLFEAIYRPGGTLDHPNSLSMFLCLVAPVLVAAASSDLPAWTRRLCWAAVGAATVGITLTLSRAGLPAFVAVVVGALVWCGSWRPTWGKAALGVLALAGLGVLFVKAWPALIERYGEATLEEEYFENNGESRGYYFRQAGVILDDQPFGVGLNNWSYWVSKRYGEPLGMHYENYDDLLYAPALELTPDFRWAAPAHNLGVLTAGELGWAGLAFFALVWLRWLQIGAGFLFSRNPDVMRRLGVGLCFGIVGVLLQSFTEWTFRQTQIFITFEVLAGILASLYALKRAEVAAPAPALEPVPEWDPETAVAYPMNN